MLSQNVMVDMPDPQEQVELVKDSPESKLAALHEEIYNRAAHEDRKLRYGNSFQSKWCQLCNYSPDDFE